MEVQHKVANRRKVANVKRWMLAILLIALLPFTSTTVVAQDVRVDIVPKTTNFPSTLSSYIDNPESFFSLRIQNLTASTVRFYLTLDIECQFSTTGEPFRLYTQDRGTSRPMIQLGPNETYNMTTRAQFEDHFSGRLATNVQRNDIANMTRLPEGTFNLCAKACRWSEVVSSDQPLGNNCYNFTVCYTGSAPELVSPLMGQVLSSGIAKITPTRNLNFRWTGVVTNCPSSAQFSYLLKIVKVIPCQNINDAIDRGTVIYTHDCGSKTFCQIDTLRDLQVSFDRGATYAVQVIATQKRASVTNTMQLGNDGKSQVVAFTWGEATYTVGQTPNRTTQPRDSVKNVSESNQVSNNQTDVEATIVGGYVVNPCNDNTSMQSFKTKYKAGTLPGSDEGRDLLLKTLSGDVHLLSPDTSRFKLQWSPVRGDSVIAATYILSLYEWMGSEQVSTSRSPLKTETFRGNIGIGHYPSDGANLMTQADTSWRAALEEGKQYLVSLDVVATYRYRVTNIKSTTHLVNGIAADTEYDTTFAYEVGTFQNSSSVKFQWGVDSTLLDKVTPPQFIYPVNRSSADWDDTAYMTLEPTIAEIEKRADFEFLWKASQNIDVADSALYELYVYHLPKGKELSAAFKDTAALVARRIFDLSYHEGDILDSLKEDQNYVARLRVRTAPDSAKYNLLNNGWSHPIVFKLVKPTLFSDAIDVTNACFPTDTAGLSRVLISPKVDSLVRNRVHLQMGRFEMIVQSAKKNKDTYTGEGYVLWNPVGYGCGIKVHFDSIKINKDYRIVSGTARTVPKDSNNYLKLNIGNNKFGAGFDMTSDYAVEGANYVAGKLGSTGDDIKKWYDRINTGANVLSEIIHGAFEDNASIGVLTTPIKINDKMLGAESENVSLALNDAFFSPVTAHMNLVAIYNSHKDNLYIPLIATNICMDPKSFYSDSVGEINLFALQDYDVPLSDGYTLRFKRPTKLGEVKDGTHITFDKKGFKKFTIDVEIDFGTKDQNGNRLLAVDMKNDGMIMPTKPVKAYFKADIKSWSNWVAKIAMDPFAVVGCEDFTFVPTGKGIFYDHSSTETPAEIKFPAGYGIAKDKQKEWQGFYLDQFTVLLPPDVSGAFVDLAGEEAVKQDSTVVYHYGANGQLTDSVAYIFSGTRISFSANQLVWDDQGLSVKISGNNLLRLETKNGGGWAFSMDTVGIAFTKSKFKEGFIKGKMTIPLFQGNIAYNCSLGTDSLVFAINPGDSLHLNLFLAKVKLDQKSSHFRITHDFGGHTYKSDWEGDRLYTYKNNNATTRVDLTLNGTVDIDLNAMKIPASLPSIKFENMYMRNYTAKETLVGKQKVQSYNFNGLQFNIGNWSKASPQKYIGLAEDEPMVDLPMDASAPADDKKPMFSGKVSGFEYSVTTLEPLVKDVSSNVMTVGIRFGGEMKLGIGEGMSVGASAGFAIWCDVNTKDYSVSNPGGEFDSARVKTDIGPLSVDGAVIHTRDDDTYGNSWRGMLKVKVMDVIDVKMGAGFGTSKRPDNSSKTFDWWYMEGAVDLGATSPAVLGPVTINGFGGGFAYNMKPNSALVAKSAKDLMGKSSKGFTDKLVSSDGKNYVPSYDAWMAKAGISLILTGDAQTMNASGILMLRIANGHFSGISMQVDANIMSSYDKNSGTASSAMVTVKSFIEYSRDDDGGWGLNFSACVNADINLTDVFLKNTGLAKVVGNVIEYPSSSLDALSNKTKNTCLSKYVEPRIESTRNYDSLEAKKQQFQSGQFGGSAKLQIPIDFYIRKYGKGKRGEVSGKQMEWFFALGRPPYDERVSFSSNLDLVVCKSSTKWTFYFMTGNYFPNAFSMPDIPTDVADFLGSKYEKAKNSRVLPTFDKGGGFAMGASFEAHISFSMLLYLKADAYIGFDAALINTNGQGCSGYSKIGKNNFYAQGQAYAMIKGEAGLELNLGFWKGHISLVEAGIGALLQAGGPNPTWAYGILAFRASCLGGVVKINTSVDFSLGHVCIPGSNDPLANVKLFQNVSPGFASAAEGRRDANKISPYSTGVIVSNLPWNQDVLLCAKEKKGKYDQDRKFRFVLNNSLCTDKSGTASPRTLQITPSTTDPNTLYFESSNGGFDPSKDHVVYLYARAFEWRKSAGNDLSNAQLNNDYYYTLRDNGYTRNTSSLSSYRNTYKWRDPLFTDNDKTTHKIFYQDTTVYFTTQAPPNTLYNQVVFTWPYNGDPHVPFEEIYQENGRYKVLIYIYQNRDDLNPGKMDGSGRQMKAFLLAKSVGPNATAEECDYSYYPNGFQNSGSGVPCIVVTLPRTFSFNKYAGSMLAVRLMRIRTSDYNATLKAMQGQAESLATQSKMERTTRSNATALQNKYRQSQSSKTTASTSSHYSKTGGGASTGQAYIDKNKTVDIERAQLQEFSANYNSRTDTAMGYNRKSLASTYAVSLKSGDPVYTLYFRFCNGFKTYRDIIDGTNLLSFSTNVGNTGSSNTLGTKNSQSLTVTRTDYNEGNNMIYLMEEYTPNDPVLYRTGVRLPAIIHPALNMQTAVSGEKTAYNSTGMYMNNVAKLYNAYATNLISLNNAIKATTAPTKRPKQDCDYKSDFCEGVKSSNWNNSWPDATRRSNYNTATRDGLVRTSASQFANLDSRIKRRTSNGSLYTNDFEGGYNYMPYEDNELGISAPVIMRVELIDKKLRIDSAVLEDGYSKQGVRHSDGSVRKYAWDCPTKKYYIIDEAHGAMLSDIKRYRQFYQDLSDCAFYISGRGYSYKVSEAEFFWNSSYVRNRLSVTDFPFTVYKSTLMTWWFHAFTAQFMANELTGKQRYKEYTSGGSNAIAPSVMSDRNGTQSLYWQQHIMRFERLPYEMSKSKGMDLIVVYNVSGKYYKWRTSWFTSYNSKSKNSTSKVAIPNSGVVQGMNLTAGNVTDRLDAFWFSVGNNSNRGIVGLLAKKTKETINNSTYHTFEANMRKANAGYVFYKTGSDYVKTVNDNNGLIFRNLDAESSSDFYWWR